MGELCAIINVKGIVQGVGFRPFVYRIATELSLLGYVQNLGDAGVEIVLEGKKDVIEKLVKIIKSNPPSIARVDEIKVTWFPPTKKFNSFHIRKSDSSKSNLSAPEIPPDIAICNDCISDLFKKGSRWYQYPFTSCAACGPRYTTITNLPYDRPNTTMSDFPLCTSCNTGYTDPLDRRYHAQTTACPKCGPSYQLIDSNGIIEKTHPIKKAARLVDKGYIVAVHGIGGTHLVTKTTTAEPIVKLRLRKRRSSRPFALMLRSLDLVKKIFEPNELEIETLTSWRRPIVLLQRKNVLQIGQIIPDTSLDVIAPGLDTIGIMLPYSAIHHLLFEHSKEPAFVMTSGNPSGMPMYIDRDTILDQLHGIADYFLIHNRRISQRVDDSVVKPLHNHTVFIRRSRGYVPDPIKIGAITTEINAMSVGAEEKATGAILKAGHIYITQHIGDTNNMENIEFLDNAIKHMMHLIGIRKVMAIGCDMHPEFLSTELAISRAHEYNIPVIKIQHHHAHLISLLVDNGIDVNTNIICITADGFGYGTDGTAWGGEVLVGDSIECLNIGGLKRQTIQGGDVSAKFAVRSFIGFLPLDIAEEKAREYMGQDLSENTSLTENTLELIFDMIKKGVNVVQTSSAGRFLDAVAFALGVARKNSYSGECPMLLESIAKEKNISINLNFFEENGRTLLDTTAFLMDLIELKEKGKSTAGLAYAAQWYLGEGLAQIAIDYARENDVGMIGFSGGVAVNRIITKSITKKVEENNLQMLLHRQIPPGDGGISVGQVVHAANIVSP